jgi:hypothetical protein
VTVKQKNRVSSVHPGQLAVQDFRAVLVTAHFCHNMSGLRIRLVSVKSSPYDTHYGLYFWALRS